jgi:hypothetical protein
MLDLLLEFSFGRHGLSAFHRAAMLTGGKIRCWRNRALMVAEINGRFIV